IKKEIAIIIGVNEQGATAMYSPVEMIFNSSLNMLDYQISPARLPEKILWKAEAIALMVVKNLNSAGIFAVELFIDINDNIWVNETAPRVHNSGHHTIEGNFSSQFDMLWRIILGYPLGNTSSIMDAALVNLVGENNITGTPVYEGLETLLGIENVFVHIYNKKNTKPGRKMGHITILSNERQELIHVANKIKQNFKISVNGRNE
ncbi:MAG: ATP-grasp domain-containing protein, partial [Bacteroidetes bacterium]|nr:ATP-grasp domain-containing protein [Bacteroidota bacterium]